MRDGRACLPKCGLLLEKVERVVGGGLVVGGGGMEMKLVEDCGGKGSNEVEEGGNKKSNEGVGGRVGGWRGDGGGAAESEVPPLI